ncbi:hypothetical protein E4U55_004970 [Claviceps digitariae]|nr:hypothetical protein E4U55_004970 [Claviceps digitariae]
MADETIILYHYAYSPYARRIIWYLALRGIPYKQCIQPPMMPRPDISRLGLGHRRIPILAIGQDIYLDSRLQLQRLETLPATTTRAPPLGATSPEHTALQHLLSRLMTDAGIFTWAVALLPSTLPLLQDPKFAQDRQDFFSGSQEGRNPGGSAGVQAVALREMASLFGFLERTLLADGREWILGTAGPRLADIEAVWPLHWLVGLPGALPGGQFSREVYPRVYAWMERFDSAVRHARERNARGVSRLTGEEAARLVVRRRPGEEEYLEHEHEHDGPLTRNGVDEMDFEARSLGGLRAGDEVVVGPTDTGVSGRDVGRLVGLNSEEVVYETTCGREGVYVHRLKSNAEAREVEGS